MLDDPQIYRRLTAVFHNVFYDDTITLHPETTADDVEAWDSANHINLIVATETEFGIHFDTSELEDLHSVADLVAVVRNKAS